jgi:hypothetical protein
LSLSLAANSVQNGARLDERKREVLNEIALPGDEMRAGETGYFRGRST